MTAVFGPLRIEFDERVLEPRAWTLLQSEWAAELAASAPPGPMLELCAGAGHIGLAAAALSGRALVQVEIEQTAAGYARRNAEAAGLADRVQVRCASMHDALDPDERFPIVVADPPYLPSAQLGRWPDDPVLAIDGGPDGLDLARDCLRVAADHLGEGAAGVLLQLAGEQQAAAVASWLAGTPQLRLAHRQTRTHDAERAVALFTRT